MRRIRFALIGAAIACATFVAPAAASAACTLNAASDDELSGGTTQTFSGNFKPAMNGKFIQVPFDVPAGTKGMRIRYCFDATNGPDQPGADDGLVAGAGASTLDLGVYGPKPNGQDNWTMAERRGWSGSALRNIGIGENGYTDPATYGTTNGTRKAYVPGFTTRAYKAGPIGAGKWAVELGAGWIDPLQAPGVNWIVEVVTSTDSDWADQPFVADPYTRYSANPAAGWYTGDLHAHGEMEPGNATMKETFDLGFKPLSAGGGGLDFMTLVDHNNDNARSVLGSYDDDYPGKLIIPGVEVTTYNGHMNAQGSDNFADFRFSDVYRWDDTNTDQIQTDDELKLVRSSIDPASQLQTVLDGGGFTQVNHPETLKAAPAACRGCAWTYTDQQTGWDKVSALEIANGPGGWPQNAPTLMNPFTTDAITLYERLLAAGNHIAAVGSSDDHKAGGATGAFDSSVGRGATVVHATSLSTQGIIDAVKAGHTYVKPFGADAPDVNLTASTLRDGEALPGDSITGSTLNLTINVKGAQSAVRPGPYTLAVLKDGVQVDSIEVSGDNFDHTYSTSESGRYSFKLTRQLAPEQTGIEAYSTPVWFTYGADPAVPVSNRFSFGAFKANRKKGTGTLKVKVASPGKVTLSGPGLNKSTSRVKKANQTVTLNLKPKSSLRKKLRKRGAAKVKVKVTNSPTGGKSLTKSKTVKLLGKKAKKRKKHH